MPDPALLQATLEEAIRSDRALIAGIAAYRADPYVRTLRDPPAVWEEGESRLMDFGGAGPAVLFIPSLINRSYILDLTEDASMMRWCAGQGMHPYLLDWGWPGETERGFTLTDYIAGRLERALGAIPGPVILAGYCMGGLLALAAAQRLPAKVSALALLATPWDFHAADPAMGKRMSDALPVIEPMMRFSNTLPIDALNAIFAMVDPHHVGQKYRDFAGQDKRSARARKFVAIEDWLADGVPLAAPVARETLGGWYGANGPARGKWLVAGLPVDPRRIAMPAFCALPRRDRLVPLAAARPLAAGLMHARVIEPDTGHIGMVAGTHAETAFWRPFAEWVQGL